MKHSKKRIAESTAPPTDKQMSLFQVDNLASRQFAYVGSVYSAELFLNEVPICKVDGLIETKSVKMGDPTAHLHALPIKFFGDEVFHCALCDQKINVLLYWMDDGEHGQPSLLMGETSQPLTWDMVNADPTILSTNYRYGL